jgi:hypothetical protein
VVIDRLVRWLAPDEVPAGEADAAPLRLPHGVTLRRSRWLTALGGRLARMGGPAAAVTLGRTIVVRPGTALSERLLRHELAHVRQWTRRPLLFPVLYTLRQLRHGYHANPYEIEARAAERGEQS